MNKEKLNKKNNNIPKKGINNLSLLKKIQIIIFCVIIFVFLFLIMYRNSKIDEVFSEINTVKAKISKVQKENDQLEVKIQTSLNLSNLEQSAKEQLGMQKLTNAQTIYITLPKKDYIEASVEDVVIEDEDVFCKLKNKIFEIFN